MSAQRTTGSPVGDSHSLSVEPSSPPTYWIGFCTEASSGSSRGQTDAGAGTTELQSFDGGWSLERTPGAGSVAAWDHSGPRVFSMRSRRVARPRGTALEGDAS